VIYVNQIADFYHYIRSN